MPHTLEDGLDHCCNSSMSLQYPFDEGFAINGAKPHYQPSFRVVPTHYDIELVCRNPESREAEAKVVVTAHGRREGATTLVLDGIGFENLSVKGEGSASALDHKYDGERITITWKNSFKDGEVRKVIVAYRIVDPVSGMAFFPDYVVTDHETERCRYWLACLDHPAIRTPLDFHLTFPESFNYVLANGSLVKEEVAQGARTAHWRQDFPCPTYLIAIAAGDFNKAPGGDFEGIELASFGPRRFHSTENLGRTFEPTKSMMEWMTDRLQAKFPWPKYYQYVMKAVGVGSAMENISLVSWDDACVQDANLREEYGHRVDGTNLHEMAHTYFGDLIVMEDFCHATIKESFANFMTVQYFHDTRGHDWYCYKLGLERSNYHKEADSAYACYDQQKRIPASAKYLRPIVQRTYNSSWQLFDSHLYCGGCVRLHTLKYIMGEERFWPAMAAYVAEYTGKTVDIHDFRKVMERFHHDSLQRYFEQFWHSKGYPNVRATSTYDSSQQLLLIRCEQTQADAAKGVHLFDLPIEVGIEVAEGEFQYNQVTLTSEGPVSMLTVPLASAPLQVIFDPNMKSTVAKVTYDGNEDMLRRSLLQGPTAAARMDAARALGRRGSRGAVQALESAFKSEPFWGVRIIIADSLADVGTQAAALAAARIVAAESDPKALNFVISSTGRFRLPVTVAAICQLLESRADLPYQAKAAALTALGSLRNDDHHEKLVAGLKNDSYFGWVRRGAAAGLGECRTDQARKTLMDRLSSGNEEEPYVRQGLCLALADCVTWASETDKQMVGEVLARVCKTDAEWRVRRSAGQALATLGLKEHLPTLRALQKRSSNQDHVLVERLIQKLAKSGPAVAPRKEIEKLTDTVTKLTGRVEELEAKLAAR